MYWKVVNTTVHTYVLNYRGISLTKKKKLYMQPVICLYIALSIRHTSLTWHNTFTSAVHKSWVPIRCGGSILKSDTCNCKVVSWLIKNLCTPALLCLTRETKIHEIQKGQQRKIYWDSERLTEKNIRDSERLTEKNIWDSERLNFGCF